MAHQGGFRMRRFFVPLDLLCLCLCLPVCPCPGVLASPSFLDLSAPHSGKRQIISVQRRLGFTPQSRLPVCHMVFVRSDLHLWGFGRDKYSFIFWLRDMRNILETACYPVRLTLSPSKLFRA